MITSRGKTVVTIGTFDGVHIGHQKIIDQLVTVAQEKNLESVVLTFFPHPRMVLQTDSNIKLINTIREKERILKQFGVSRLEVNSFTKAFSRLTAQEFVEQILVNQLNVSHIIIGYDHHFGRNRNANIKDLKRFGLQFGFTVQEISAQDINQVAVSSTKIRQALHKGDITTANLYLNYNYQLTGTVIKGKGIGKTIDYPTANIKIEEDYKLIPKEGVYVVKTLIKGQQVYGMMNIGFNPTVNGTKKSTEVHLFDFNDNLYGQNLSVSVLKRLRDEVKFDSIKTLKKQLQKDQENALNFISNA
jgi:riboflavin kinase/FMN adenylyltransferase